MIKLTSERRSGVRDKQRLTFLAWVKWIVDVAMERRTKEVASRGTVTELSTPWSMVMFFKAISEK